MAFNITYDIVSIARVAAEYAVCRTSYGAEITVYWASGKPDPLPRVGETWRVEQYSRNTWRFVSNVPRGEYKYMSYAISLDAKDCIGRERVIVDDISNAGFDSVYIRVADYGEVMWKSDVASSYGLISYGDNLTQLVERFNAKSIPIVFVIGSTLWYDTSNYIHNSYQQVKIENNQPVFSSIVSPQSARAALSEIVSELFRKYGNVVNGVCFDGACFDGENSDFSHGMAQLYHDVTGKRLSYRLASYDYSDTWFEDRAEFENVRAIAISNLTAGIYNKIGYWPVSLILPPHVCAVGDATKKIGRLGTGIPGDIGNRGFTRVGFCMTPQLGSDVSSEMRSFEVQVATLMRLSERCKPLPVLDSSRTDLIAGELEILAKYGAGEVLVTDYRRWRLLTDDQMIALSDAMSQYKVYVDSFSDSVGVLLSSMSRDVGCYFLDDIISFQNGFESTCSEVIDKVPHKLKVIFDNDLAESVFPNEISALMLYESTNMTDDSVAFVNGLSGFGIVFVGECGKYVGQSLTKRTSNPFAAMFTQAMSETVDYENKLVLGAGVTDVSDTVYSFVDRSIGYVPAFGVTGSYSDANDEENVNAPVVISGRSALVGMSVSNEPSLQSVTGELVAYAIGRGD